MKRRKLRPIELRVWQLLCDNAARSTESIAEEINYAASSVNDAITTLVALGYIGRRYLNAHGKRTRAILVDYYTAHAIDE